MTQKEKFAELPNFKKAIKKIGLHKKKIDTYRKKIKILEELKEAQEKILDESSLDLYGISVRNNNKGELDVIHITGFCEYEGKPGFRYKSIYQYIPTMDCVCIEDNARWFVSSVNRDYKPSSKYIVERTIRNHMLKHDKSIKNMKDRFFKGGKNVL